MFRAYDAERERLVAIKLFRLDLPPERVHQLVAAFEQLVAADLNHPAIARPLATGMSGVAAYLAQDYIAAESLDLAVREYGPAPAADALRVAAQLAGALDFAAAVNVHHGALHPRDVLLSADETRLTGVGVAQALQAVGVSAPIRRPYSAPERSADASITTRADLFSLAAVVYELLTGKRIAGTGDAAVESLTDVPGADRDALCAVFARALAETPGARFESALAFVEALRGALPEPSSVVSRQASGESRPSKKTRPRTDDSRLMTDDLRQTTLLPLDEPELPPPAPALAPIADELPIVVPEAPEPQLRDEVVPDLPLTAPLPPPPVVPPETPAVQHEVFASALEESRSAVWPLMLALGVGLAVGFAAGYGVGNHDRATPLSTVAAAASPAPPQPAGKEFTESAVNPDSRVPNPESRIPNPEGSLTLHTTPSGAHVMLDGQAAGVTPLVANHVSNGPHRVLISHDGYVTVERRVMITTAQPSLSLTVPLERERVATHGTRPAPAAATATPGTAGRVAGTLSIDSRPTGAKVFLDGKLVGRTPLALPSVSAGEHAVRLERDGYHRWTSSVRIVASEQNRVTASLER